MTTRQRFITQALVGIVFMAALLIVGHAAHAAPMPITCHEMARQTAVQDANLLAAIGIIIAVICFV